MNKKALDFLGITERDFEPLLVTQDEKNAANIDYIAMMCGIELPEVEDE